MQNLNEDKPTLEYRTQSPVLFITFARPEYASRSFEGIRKAKPASLYFYSNLARAGIEQERQNNLKVRELINRIDWECELHTFFRTEHVDIYTSLLSAIDWVFANEEKAIVIEEDCVASVSFFKFCDEMLDRYVADKRVWIVSGDNFTPLTKANSPDTDYYFSRYPHIYGWASWRDRWKLLDREMLSWPSVKNGEVFRRYFLSAKEANFWKQLFARHHESISTRKVWDFLFVYARIVHGAWGIVPKHNLVSNIGVSGTHNAKKKAVPTHNLPALELNWEKGLDHPDSIQPNNEYDKHHFLLHILPKIKRLQRTTPKGFLRRVLGNRTVEFIKRMTRVRDK